MSRNVTLGQLHADVRDQASVGGATVRHAPTMITRQINQSIQRFREKLSIEGASHYLTAATGTLSTGPTSPYQFQTLDLSAASPAIVRVFSVDITVNGEVITLKHVPFEEREKYGSATSNAVPVAWAAFGTSQLAIMPPPNATYAYTVWYLPVLSDLSNMSDTFDGVSGWEEFIVWDVCTRVIVRDQYPNAFAMAVQCKNEVWRDILNSATKVTGAGGAVVGRDTMGKAMVAGYSKRRILPPP